MGFPRHPSVNWRHSILGMRESHYYRLMNRRQRAIQLVSYATMLWEETLGDWTDGWESKHAEKLMWLSPYDTRYKWLAPVCGLLTGHMPMDDQCMRPDHRYCQLCEKTTANEDVHPIWKVPR